MVEGATVTLLIGCDHAALHFPVETRPAPDPAQAHQGFKTRLGWILKGPDGDGQPPFLRCFSNIRVDERLQNTR